MSKPFDYSKWDNIELSDDEDDVHPNIDRESWFRMKHRSRVEREDREEADKKRLRNEMATTELRMKEITHTLQQIETSNDKDSDDSDEDDLEDVDGLKAELKELETSNAKRVDKLNDYEKNKKWNVDNMCKVVEERTVINPKGAKQDFSKSGFALPDDPKDEEDDGKKSNKKSSSASVKTSSGEKKNNNNVKDSKASSSKPSSSSPKPKASPSKKPSTTSAATATTTTTTTSTKAPTSGPEPETIAMMSYHEFTVKYSSICETFMTKRTLAESRDYLLQNASILLQENASNYLLLASLEDEMNGFHEKMKLTARQSQIVSNIAELARSLESHPGNVIIPFFRRLEEKEHLMAFMDGVNSFTNKIEKRAVVKRKEMDEERRKEEEEHMRNSAATGAGTPEGGVDLMSVPKEDRLGPGGLDPVEVFDSLPKSMQEAFESRDMEKLKKALMDMDVDDAEVHMKRCVDSGLWNEG